MPSERDEPHPTDPFGMPEGLLAAIVCAGLLISSFVLTTAYTIMPPGERWGGLTTFSLLTVAYTLPGSAAIYDALGRTVRRDWRALAALAALVPALYLAYSVAVDQFQIFSLISAILFVTLPAVALVYAASSRTPTTIDAVGLGYLWLSLQLKLLPGLGLPEQGPLVGFFQLAAPPLLLLLLAARGWPGLGFTWFLSAQDLRMALLASSILLPIMGGLSWALGIINIPTAIPNGGALIGAALAAYFFTTLPTELLLRGVAQNGIARVLSTHDMPHASIIGLAAGAILAFTCTLISTAGSWQLGLITGIASLGYGWIYQHTGKVTASAVPHMFVALMLVLLAAA
ncbi:MAG: hypothetical protein HGA19_23980 [Oscillochloris sp.]|nr:hypothetical protein [Oscillochloris sp.]